MLALRNPTEAYRRIDLDARVAGGDQATLVMVCYETLTFSLSAALNAHQRGDNSAKSASLTRAMSALTALQMGIRQDHPLSAPLHQLIGAARDAVLASVLAFDTGMLERVRDDFHEIAQAMA